MKTTWFGTERMEFAKCLRSADHRHMPGELFQLFLTMTYCALFQKTWQFAHFGEQHEETEKEYMRAVGQVKYPKKMKEAFFLLVDALEKHENDFLGSFSAEIGSNDVKYRGQCFTPQSVCDLMAQMQVGDLKPESGKTLTISEPACGGGAMLIAVSRVLKDNGFYPWHYHVYATDASRRCYEMTYIQTTLLGIPAVVECGNTLTLETHCRYRNFISLMHPEKKKRSKDEPNQPEETTVADVGVSSEHSVQLELF